MLLCVVKKLTEEKKTGSVLVIFFCAFFNGKESLNKIFNVEDINIPFLTCSDGSFKGN